MNHLPRTWGIAVTALVLAITSQTASAQTSTSQELAASSVTVTPDAGPATPLPAPAAGPAAGAPGGAAPAAGAPSAGTPASAALTAEEAQNSTGGNVAELQRMIHGSELTELRTSYNGSYGASLLFYGKELTYYIALFQQKNFWRVIKTQDAARAEAIYADFVRHTAQLSDVEIRRTKLEAQKAYTDRMIALSQDRAARLQADLSVAQAQQAEVASRQKQAQAQAQALNAEKAAAQSQLRELQRHIRELQRQNEAGLPALARGR